MPRRNIRDIHSNNSNNYSALSNSFNDGANLLLKIPHFTFARHEVGLKKLLATAAIFFPHNAFACTADINNFLALKLGKAKPFIGLSTAAKVLASIKKGAMLQSHSGEVNSGDVFVALPGTAHHGLQFFSQIKNKASLIIADVKDIPHFFAVNNSKNNSKHSGLHSGPRGNKNKKPQLITGNAGVLLVEDVQTFANNLACVYYGHPTAKQQVVGITGTNGKTSIAQYLGNLQLSLHKKNGVAIVGTLGVQYFKTGKWYFLAANNTTMEAVLLQQTLAFLLSEGVRSVVMEISSHALALGRVTGLQLNSVLFTSLTPDHLDFHGSMQEYFKAKVKILSLLNSSRKKNKFAVLALQLRMYGITKYIQQCSFPCFFLAAGKQKKTATNFCFTSLFTPVENIKNGLQLQLSSQASCAATKKFASFYLPGMFTFFQAENAAFCLLHAATSATKNILAEKNEGQRRAEVQQQLQLMALRANVCAAIAKVSVPGRMMQVRPFPIFIDYAHTSDALKKALLGMKHLPQRDLGGKLVVVFGCGGNRDKSKRAEMGAIAARHSDVCLVTSDNPRSENPKKIIFDVLAGISKHAIATKGTSNKSAVVLAIENREMAIGVAVQNLQAGDVLLVAGKGHEAVQITATGSQPFDEAAIIRTSANKFLLGTYPFFLLQQLEKLFLMGKASVLKKEELSSWHVLASYFTRVRLVQKKSTQKKLTKEKLTKEKLTKEKLIEEKLIEENSGFLLKHANALAEANGVFYDTRSWQGEEIFFSFEGKDDAGIFYLRPGQIKKLKVIVASNKRKQAVLKILNHLSAAAAHPKVIFVNDVFAAYGFLAKYKMQNLLALHPNSKVVAVTGSAGKSSLKEGLGWALRFFTQNMPAPANSFIKNTPAEKENKASTPQGVFSSFGNFNNHIGLPQNILSITKPYKFYVFEMGMNHAGEIAYLSSIITPHYAFITSIMAAHIENFKTVENIATAKAEFLPHGFYKKNSQKKNNLFLPSNIAFSSFFKREAKKHLWNLVEIPMENFFSEVWFDSSRKLFFTKLKVTSSVPPRVRPQLDYSKVAISKAVAMQEEERHLPNHQSKKKISNVTISGIYPHGAQLFSALYTFIFSLVINGGEAEVSFKKETSARKLALDAIKAMPSTLMPRRFEVVCNKPVIIDDAYNANPTSMMEAIEFIKTITKKCVQQSKKTEQEKKSFNTPFRRYVLVLGSMLELGLAKKHYHEAVVHEALSLAHKEHQFYFLFVGSNFVQACQNIFLPQQNFLEKSDMLEWKHNPANKVGSGKRTHNIKNKNMLATRNADASLLHVAIGQLAVAKTTSAASNFLTQRIKKDDFVFFKASNGMQFSAVVDDLINKFAKK